MKRLRVVVAIVVFSAVPVGAQNLLVNPGFDLPDQLDGWSCTSTYGFATWSADDRLGSPDSGSVQHDMENSSNSRSMWCAQCVSVTAGDDYIASGWYLWPNDPDVSQLGTTRVSVWYYENADCSGATFIGPNEIVNPVLDTWTFVSTDVSTAPAGYQSAIVFFITWQNFADEHVRVRLDDLTFSLASAIFQDGFESGDLTRWSSSTP